MHKRTAIQFGVILVLAVATAGLVLALRQLPSCRMKSRTAPEPRASFAWPAMGTVAEFEAVGDAAVADRMRNVVADAIAEVEDELSVFKPESVVARLNHGDVDIPEGSHAAVVLRFALQIAESSDGAFDPTVGPLMRAWGFRGGVPAVPSDAVLSNALASVGWRRVRIEPSAAGCLRISAGGAEIDLGAIAKGYSVDCAYDALVASGFTDFLINLGGNIRVCGSPEPGRREWNIAVRDPSGRHPPSPLPRPLRSGEAVATSGSYERFVEIDGRRYSHIIDPRTGFPVDNGLGSVSVIAPNAMMADACSTTLFVLGREAAADFLSARPGCTAVFIGDKAARGDF